MPIATVSSKGQVTIPKQVREALEVDTGDRVAFVVREDGVVELRPETTDLKDLFGLLPTTRESVTVEEMNEAIRHAASEE